MVISSFYRFHKVRKHVNFELIDFRHMFVPNEPTIPNQCNLIYHVDTELMFANDTTIDHSAISKYSSHIRMYIVFD